MIKHPLFEFFVPRTFWDLYIDLLPCVMLIAYLYSLIKYEPIRKILDFMMIQIVQIPVIYHLHLYGLQSSTFNLYMGICISTMGHLISENSTYDNFSIIFYALSHIYFSLVSETFLEKCICWTNLSYISFNGGMIFLYIYYFTLKSIRYRILFYWVAITLLSFSVKRSTLSFLP